MDVNGALNTKLNKHMREERSWISQLFCKHAYEEIDINDVPTKYRSFGDDIGCKCIYCGKYSVARIEEDTK